MGRSCHTRNVPSAIATATSHAVPGTKLTTPIISASMAHSSSPLAPNDAYSTAKLTSSPKTWYVAEGGWLKLNLTRSERHSPLSQLESPWANSETPQLSMTSS